jgi:nitrogen fixation/metabolism regulation signal transduction histidine kinase
VILMVAATLLSRRLARQISYPLQRLTDGTRKVAAGNLEHRVDVEAPGEIGELVGAFNNMTTELETSKEDLMRAERVAAWQGVARRLAHEIKNPLTPITLAMHRINKHSQDPAIADAVTTVLEEAGNLKRLANEFSEYARLPEPKKEPVDLPDLVDGVCDLYIQPDRVKLVRRDDDGPHVVIGDAGLLRQVVANLVKNAVAAMGETGTLEIELTRHSQRVTMSLGDNGPGLPDPVEQVFAPYYTTKESGTGLGLAIARKIVEDHGGRLNAENAAGGGAVFRLELPVEQES